MLDMAPFTSFRVTGSYTSIVSRAFVNEDAGAAPERYPLPARDDPGYALAAARALLRGADVGDTPGAEVATGYYFGDPALRREVEQILGEARDDRDERLEQLAERFLRRVARGRA
jgi:hypothetical protein